MLLNTALQAEATRHSRWQKNPNLFAKLALNDVLDSEYYTVAV